MQENAPMRVSMRQTIPKSQLQDRIKMKFSWKANWEILLVLTIIVVGIVITTIAAIRSKDKHLLVLPEDADFSPILSGGTLPDNAGSVPPLPQTDFQLHGTLSNLDDESTETTTRRPTSRRVTLTSAQQLAHHREAKSSPATTQSSVIGHHNSLHQNSRKNTFASSTTLGYDDRRLFSKNEGEPANTGTPSDTYDAASTESTPTQVRSDTYRTTANGHFDASQGSRQKTKIVPPSLAAATGSATGEKGQRNVGSSFRLNGNQPASTGNENQVDDSVDLGDDIHTTRSTLAGANSLNNFPDNYPNRFVENSNSDGRAQNHNTPSGSDQPATLFPSLAVHGLYGLRPSPSINAHNKVVVQGSKSDPHSLLDTDDMMTSYSKSAHGNSPDSFFREGNNLVTGNNNSNLSTSLLSNFMAGNSTMPSIVSSESSPDLSSNFNSPHQPVAGYMRGASLPFSILLKDLIKLAKPAPMVDTQANIEQPANTRPQSGSILQQLRSLPGPLLTLLQGSSVLNDLSTNHEVSESNPHYQRISMLPTDIGSILARSLRSSALPAFPPPKGVSQSWIPPTSGGDASVNDVSNAQADFVAGNTAGFLRATGSPQTLTSNQHENSAEQAHQSSPNNNNQQSYQQIASTTNDAQRHRLSHEENNPQPRQQQQPQLQQHQQISGPDQSINAGVNFQQSPKQVASYQQNLNLRSQINFGGLPMPPGHPQANGMQSTESSSNQGPDRSLANQIFIDSIPMYNSRQYSENLPVPLGYQPQQNLASQINKLSQRPAATIDFSMLPGVESAPKATITSSVVSSVLNNKPQQSQQLKQQSINKQAHDNQQQRIAPSGRRRRSIRGQYDDNSGEEEELLDSQLISVVRPDGQPMDDRESAIFRLDRHSSTNRDSAQRNLVGRKMNKKIMGDDQMRPSSSQRQVNHLDLEQSALHHYATTTNDEDQLKHQPRDDYYRRFMHRRMRFRVKNPNKNGNSLNNEDDKIETKKYLYSSGKNHDDYHRTRPSSKKLSKTALDVAGSGLMSKLLGTASTNDETEEDNDGDDDDSANEKRKEELDDAEFGIINDDQTNTRPQLNEQTNALSEGADSQVGNGELSRLQQNSNNNENDSSLGSGSSGNEAYARRTNQQRADIEFYGHPGEESRQLKYGILGSGNYEVVNGGIYPEADESTAAVNSVANYVRRPNLLLANLPKLLGHESATLGVGGGAGGREGGAQAAAVYMPGGRVSGFMRGASATSPDEFVGMMPAGDILTEGGVSKNLLVDALLDPNLITQLGGSGTSARTTYMSQDESLASGSEQLSPENKSSKLTNQSRGGDSGDKENHSLRKDSSRLKKSKSKVSSLNYHQSADDKRDFHGQAPLEGDHNRLAKDKSLSISGSKPQGTNQFNSYEISPSKKVTIYSDQDLDSSPSEQSDQRIEPRRIPMQVVAG